MRANPRACQVQGIVDLRLGHPFGKLVTDRVSLFMTSDACDVKPVMCRHDIARHAMATVIHKGDIKLGFGVARLHGPMKLRRRQNVIPFNAIAYILMVYDRVNY